jgi:hypothetical protein
LWCHHCRVIVVGLQPHENPALATQAPRAFRRTL